MEYKAIIGLEIHIEMNTKSKMFSSAPVTFGFVPNTSVDYLDMAFPGSMPVVNKQAVINGIRTANALHMEIDDTLQFERKNYFYSDLPKGYQLTQQFRPLGKNGYLEISGKRINIARLHLEEDTCKQIHQETHSFIDYNRSGIPLIEIVTNPELENGVDAVKCIEEIRSIVTFLDVSKGKMEEGNIRVDVNVSLRRENSRSNYKVEIKNLNSLVNVKNAIEYEVKRQKELLDNGQKIHQETRRYDEAKKATVELREKISSIDYRYFTDTNIPPINLSKEFIANAIESSNELASEKKKRYISLGLSENEATILTSEKDLSIYFDRCLSQGVSTRLVANWIITEVLGVLNKKEIEIANFNIDPNKLVSLLIEIEKGTINLSQGKLVFEKMVETNKTANEIIQELDLTQILDETIIIEAIRKIIDNNSNLVIDYKEGKTKVVGYIVGLLMKESKGKINPALANKLTNGELKRR